MAWAVKIVSTKKQVDTLNARLHSHPITRTRRTHTDEFKARAVEACLQPGASIAAVALASRINANLLRRWIKAYCSQPRSGLPANIAPAQPTDRSSGTPPTLVPVKLEAADVQRPSDIQIEIRRQQTIYQIAWPTSEATACGIWLRELLR